MSSTTNTLVGLTTAEVTYRRRRDGLNVLPRPLSPACGPCSDGS